MSLESKIRKKLIKLLMRSLKREGVSELFINPYDMLGQQVLEDGIHERGYLENLLIYLDHSLGRLRDLSFVDAGANIGNHSIFFSRHFSEGYAFEPMPLAHKVCEANFLLNRIDNVSLHNLGLDTESRTLPFFQHGGNLGGSGFCRPNDELAYLLLECETVRGDQFLPLLDRCKKIGLVKIDVEGFEANVIDGLSKILQEDSPVVVFESHGTTGVSSIKILERLGYSKFLSINKKTRLGFSERYTIDQIGNLSENHMYPMIVASKT